MYSEKLFSRYEDIECTVLEVGSYRTYFAYFITSPLIRGSDMDEGEAILRLYDFHYSLSEMTQGFNLN